MAYESPELKENPSWQKRQDLENKRQTKLPDSKLPNSVWIPLMVVCVCLDVLEYSIDALAGEYVLGEIANEAIDWSAEFLFYIFFKMRGINLSGTRTAVSFFGGFAIEVLTGGIISLWTLDIGLVVLFTKLEEEALKKSLVGKILKKNMDKAARAMGEDVV